jgi:hypothetical protein
MAAVEPITIGPGTVVAGTYEVTEVIGRGGMGAVWAARHLRLPGKRVAIKVLLGTSVGEQALARFRREAEITSRIGHPNIVEVLDFNTLGDGTPYQVLEFLDGESLGQRLRRGPIPQAETMELVLQIGSALRAAHRAGVVHRDLKPDNIFLCPTDSGGVVNNRVKILDFGISKIRGSQTVQTQESILIGTPQYMSPEQASGKNQTVDQRTDVFALGAIVYEMLAGRPAFSGDSVVAVIMDVVQGVPTPLATLVPTLPAGAERAVGRALAKHPDERFPEIGDFVTALTGRTLQTLGSDARGSSNLAVATQVASSSPSGARPLSAEEMVGETIAPPIGGGGGTAVMPSPATGSPPTVVARPGVAGSVAQAHARGKPANNRVPLLLGIGAAMLALIAAGIWVLQLRGGKAGSSAGVVAPVVPVVTKTKEPAGDSEDPARAVIAARAASEEHKVAASAADAAVAPRPIETAPAPVPARKIGPKIGQKIGHAPAHASAGEAIPPEVAAQLAEADRLLAAGDAGEAIRKARQSFFTLKTDRGWALLARAFCAKGDLENAKASFRNLRAGAPERAAAARACKAKGIDLR